MRITGMTESVELCTESGWSAYDVTVDEPIEQEVIVALGGLGALTYLSSLKQPFYRIEEQYYMIKGLEGSFQLRVAMLIGEEEILDRVKEILEKH